jgi:hypothetical protein
MLSGFSDIIGFPIFRKPRVPVFSLIPLLLMLVYMTQTHTVAKTGIEMLFSSL